MNLIRCDGCEKEIRDDDLRTAERLKELKPNEKHWPLTVTWAIGAEMQIAGHACSADCARRLLIKSINEELPPTKS